MKKVIIMRAIPGSGKSTFAKQLAKEVDKAGGSAKIVSADDYFYNLGEGKYKFDVTKIGDAHAGCMRAFIEALQTDVNVVIVDNTNLGIPEISPYRLVAAAYGYPVEVKQVEEDVDVAASRNQHGVPADAIERMHQYMKTEEEKYPPFYEPIEKYKGVKTDEDDDIKFSPIVNKAYNLSSLFYLKSLGY